MINGNLCARCESTIEKERLAQMPVICNHCGYSDPYMEQSAETDLEKQISRFFIIAGILVMALMAHVVHWQKHSMTVLPLKFQSALNMETRESLMELSVICTDLSKYDCVEKNYKKLLSMDTQDLVVRDLLARLQALRGKDQLAMQNFKRYFEDGGTSALTAHRYAMVLKKTQYTEDAEAYFKFALEQKPGILQVTVIKDYVAFMKDQGRYKDARKLIKKYRRNGAPDHFLSQEYKELTELSRKS